MTRCSMWLPPFKSASGGLSSTGPPAVGGGGTPVMLCSNDILSASLALKQVQAQQAPDRQSLSRRPSRACVQGRWCHSQTQA